MTADEERAALDFAIMQWSLILIDDQLKDRPADREACIRDLVECE